MFRIVINKLFLENFLFMIFFKLIHTMTHLVVFIDNNNYKSNMLHFIKKKLEVLLNRFQHIIINEILVVEI